MMKRLAVTLCIFIASKMVYGAEQPNIVLIMADDLGIDSVEDYGGRQYKTPVMSQLAKDGMRFSHAYAQPLCTNTRIQLMTGIYNHRNWIAFGILDPQAKTFGHYLQDAGYKTAIVGKWQLQSYDPPDYPGAIKRRDKGMQVHKAGFDDYCLWHTHHTEDKGSRYPDPKINLNGQYLTDTKGRYGPDVWADYICEYVSQKHAKPFFLYYPMALPHNPFSPTPDSAEWKDSQRRFDEEDRFYGDMVEYTDKVLGRIVAAIDEAGIAENTILIFYSDNGTNQKIHTETAWGLSQGGKGLPIDAGVHVPLYVRWKGKVAAGSVNDKLVDSTDFLPTILEAAGAPVPAKDGLDGISFYKQMLGQRGPERPWVFYHYDPRPGWDKHKFTLHRFIQDRQYKLYDNGILIDVKNDPLEQHLIYAEDDTRVTAAVRRKFERVLNDKYIEWREARPANNRLVH
ncbi:MAG: sulfatase-like hydrolase/transferase [Planctomycetota bacterium]|nr:sulfatase-like hydrolase/transferase [Planctomycetota bacterium]